MTKLFLSLLLLMGSLLFASCSNSNSETIAEKSIKDKLRQSLNDPKSYEPVSFQILLNNTTNKTVLIKHIYRSRNRYNGLVKSSEYFMLKNNKVILEFPGSTGEDFKDLIHNEDNGDRYFIGLGMFKSQLLLDIEENEESRKKALVDFSNKVSKMSPDYIDRVIESANLKGTSIELLTNMFYLDKDVAQSILLDSVH